MATSYPFKVSGACGSTAKNVFKVNFSQPLSAVPQLRAYDNAAAFPNTDSSTSTAYTIFKGSTVNGSLPMLHFLDTTRGGPATAGWMTQSTYGVGKATCLMAGDSSYLTFRYSTASVGVAGGTSLFWNAALKIPNDVNPTLSRHHNIAVRYTFTSTIPVVSLFANNADVDAGGTEASPAWGTITPDSEGVRFGSSTATNTSILANIPLSGQEYTTTAWVAQS